MTSSDATHVRGISPRRTASADADVTDVGRLFTEHAPFLVRVVERMTGSASQAEDIVQEAFVVAYRRRRELRDGPEVRGWLYRVCANAVRQHRRSLWRRFRLMGAVASEPIAPLPAGVPDEVAARRAHAAMIRATLLALPFIHREALVLFELEGESTRDIAALVGIPEGTVSTRLARARALFREQWSTQGDAP